MENAVKSEHRRGKARQSQARSSYVTCASTYAVCYTQQCRTTLVNAPRIEVKALAKEAPADSLALIFHVFSFSPPHTSVAQLMELELPSWKRKMREEERTKRTLCDRAS